MNFLELFNTAGLIAAHRGARSIAPENSMSALRASVGYCDFIEIDVQLSSDGVCVIMHDDTLERTTNIKDFDIYKNRKPYRVSDFTFEELSHLDYGSWFNKEYEPLLTLHGALGFIKDNQLYINIEIKDIHKYFSDKEVISAVLGEIKDLQVESQVLLSSFRHEYLSILREKSSNIATAALVEDKHPGELIKYLTKLHVDAYHLNDELAEKATVAKLRKAGFFVSVYTVNDPVRAKELFGMGVNGVFSDSLKEKV